MLETLVRPVAKKKPAPRDRLDLRVDPDLVARIVAQAERFGLSVSAYVRQSVTEKLEEDEATDARLKGRR